MAASLQPLKPQRTVQEKPGGQTTACASQAELPRQSMMQCVPPRLHPPVQTEGQEPPGGLVVPPQLQQAPAPLHSCSPGQSFPGSVSALT
jgi:hypothetical protein